MKKNQPKTKSLTSTLHQIKSSPSSLPPYLHLLHLLTSIIPTTTSILLNLTQQLHAHISSRGLLLPSAAADLIAAYLSSGDRRSAAALFFHNPPATFLCNSIIRYSSPFLAALFFRSMRSAAVAADHYTLPFLLKSCAAELRLLPLGAAAHAISISSAFFSDLYVSTALLHMYSRHGYLSHARKLFDSMPSTAAASWNVLIAAYMSHNAVAAAEIIFSSMEARRRNVVSYTAMISGYTLNGMHEKALSFFHCMIHCEEPNRATILSVLPACERSTGGLDHGREIHRVAADHGLVEENEEVQSALITMYARCGSLEEARGCFDGVEKKGVSAWNAMVGAYALYGMGEETIRVFEEMVGGGVRPDFVTFVGLLSGCGRGGMVEKGVEYFRRMGTVYGVWPGVEHYSCVVDMVGRAGGLGKEMTAGIGVEDGSLWGAVLGAGRKHGDVEMAEKAAEKLFLVEPENTGNYVVLCNVYAGVGRWKEVDDLREKVKVLGLRKRPGCSWMEVDGDVFTFFGGDATMV